jgi:lysine 6-dehydrogenase
MYHILIVGAGRVGSVIARDLSDDPEIKVILADADIAKLTPLTARMPIDPMVAKLDDPEKLAKAAADVDLVVGALPGHLGRRAMEGVVETGKKGVDISFMAEDPRGLDARAKETGAVVVYDFGVAPGMSNLLAAVEALRLAPVEEIQICVGGLPALRREPWAYAAPFSPIDVIEEYTRPARIRVAGQEVIRPPLSDVTHVEIPGIGTLEAFLSDGLRSMIDTVDCPNMWEKTLRYPGHRDRIKLLADTGFFSSEPIDVDGVRTVPRAVTLSLLEAAWRPDSGSDEFTVMQISVTGANGQKRVWHLLDRTDTVREESSMARTTGFPAAILARKMVRGEVGLMPGIHPPEALAKDDGFVDDLLKSLARRGVTYRCEDLA